jgi:hypothetical protein
MAAPSPSSVSEACRAMAQFLNNSLQVGDATVRVTVGNPADAAPSEQDADHRINLFFYRFEPIGFGPDRLPGETWQLRAHCLVTPFALLEDNISAGENDLRLLGEVVRIFHETPERVITVAVYQNGGEGVEEQFHIQTVFQPLGLEEINHLWSIQGGDIAYRPSLAYEIALAPVIPRSRAVGSPLVGATGVQVHPHLAASTPTFEGVVQTPVLRPVQVNTQVAQWVPQICFVHQGVCAQALSFQMGSAALAAFVPSVWVAGEVGTQVSLRWELWDSQTGWTPQVSEVSAVIGNTGLDPARVDLAVTHTLALPLSEAGQAVLYAVRSFTRQTDGATVAVRSNPLLLSLYPD